MQKLISFIYSVLAGVAIAVAGTVFLSVENKVVGAVFFTVGLFTILTLDLNLFTGSVCYIFERDKAFAMGLPGMWLGNMVGAWAGAAAMSLTRFEPILSAKAAVLCGDKLNDSMLSIFILSMFCNMLIFLAVENYAENKHETGKYLSLFVGISVFILCGFEHCVANMFYFSIAGAVSGKTFLYLLVMTFGNAVGGLIIPVARLYKAKLNPERVAS